MIKKPRLDHEHYSPISNVENTSNTSPGGFESQEPTSFQTFSDDIIIGDPAKRPKFSEYNVNIQDQVRRAYLLQGPCQPRGHDFPTKMYGKVARRFVVSWFDKYNWLEYSVINEKAYCLPCYLFKQVSDQGGGDVFVTEGFSNWKKKERLDTHIGEPNKRSMHKDVVMKCKDLMDGKGHIEVAFVKQSSEAREHYLTRLNASIDVVRLLLHQGLPFRGHREAENSDNQGNFLETLKFLGDHNEEIKKVTLKNAPKNCKATSPPTQKEIVSVIGSEIRDVIIDEMKNELFSLLVDESRDCSLKEQMAVVLRYVNKKGQIIERFFTIVHVTNTSALSLKAALDDLFSNHGLSLDNELLYECLIDVQTRLLKDLGNSIFEKTKYGEVLSKDGSTGFIYINGVKVAEEENFLFSYNITNLTYCQQDI
ncbi:MAG: DUF4371 domain-containing protein [Erysipelotrichaceae bacterium]|nr:DUF4371 domain-containing protein [Erysipelotrichaceae bacterium]